jgi:hypothetical protein
LVVSQQNAARMLDCCVDTVISMAKRGKLERVRLNSRRWAITMASIKELIGKTEAA